jgi:dephospho-CoA kinase
MARSGFSRQAVAQIMSQQATRAERLACADVVILNDGIDLAELKQRVHEMWASFGL